MSPFPPIEARGIDLKYGSGKTVFTSLDLILRNGEFLAVVGPSGCGKTSLLKILGGFLQPSAGYVNRNGSRINSPSPEAVMIFQEFDQLFPWKRVWENTAFPLKAGGKSGLSGLDESEKQRRVEEILREVGLFDYRSYFPHQLSGGMKQRAALARALVSRPPVLLMDEPFGSLDAQKREELQSLLLRMWREHDFSVVFVTHDITEALLLADRILVMESAVSGGNFTLMDLELPRPRDVRSEDFNRCYNQVFSKLGSEDPGQS